MPFQRPDRRVERIFLHCSASDSAEADDVEVIRRWHKDPPPAGRGWSDVGYHFFIKKDGEIQEGRPLEKTPAAQAGQNRGTIAICVHCLAIEKFTQAQYEIVIQLCGEIDEAYGGMVTFHGHCEVSSKTCPVFPYKEVLGLDAHGSMTQPKSATPQGAQPPQADLPVLRLTDRGSAVKELQRRLNAAGSQLTEDGIFGQATLKAVLLVQRDHGLSADGIVGPATWGALAGAN